MISRALLAAIFVGLFSGLFMTAVQQWRVIPLIIAAEAFENETPGSHDHGKTHQHGAVKSHLSLVTVAFADESPEGQDSFGLSRLGGTLLANLVAGSGFALLLFGFSTLICKPLTGVNALSWAACSWLAFHFLPAIGVPPELPGFPAADLQSRQYWWVATVGLSAAGLAAIALKNGLAFKLAGLALIAIPHVFGAPQPVDITSSVPAFYAAEYAVAALTASLISWLVLAFGLGLANEHLQKAAS